MIFLNLCAHPNADISFQLNRLANFNGYDPEIGDLLPPGGGSRSLKEKAFLFFLFLFFVYKTGIYVSLTIPSKLSHRQKCEKV